jgi:hypothetical protein
MRVEFGDMTRLRAVVKEPQKPPRRNQTRWWTEEILGKPQRDLVFFFFFFVFFFAELFHAKRIARLIVATAAESFLLRGISVGACERRHTTKRTRRVRAFRLPCNFSKRFS